MIPNYIAYIPNYLRPETIIYSQQENTCNSNTIIGLFCVLLDAKVYVCLSSSFLEILGAHHQYSTCPIKKICEHQQHGCIVLHDKSIETLCIQCGMTKPSSVLIKVGYYY